jgi:chemotaxis protein CheD
MNSTPPANHKLITLLPGQWYFGNRPDAIQTLLGSCVAITLWHPQYRYGGMCHYLLPRRGPNTRLRPELEGYYAEDALAAFRRAIAKTGLREADFEAKMFGGGSMFDISSAVAVKVADNNIQQGVALLESYHFKLMARDLGGRRYRKIQLKLATGEVWVQYGQEQTT